MREDKMKTIDIDPLFNFLNYAAELEERAIKLVKILRSKKSDRKIQEETFCEIQGIELLLRKRGLVK